MNFIFRKGEFHPFFPGIFPGYIPQLAFYLNRKKPVEKTTKSVTSNGQNGQEMIFLVEG
jgi:hypothetical protein